MNEKNKIRSLKKLKYLNMENIGLQSSKTNL